VRHSGGAAGEVHADFRLWACVPTDDFHTLPGALLTAGVLVALEPPRHLQAHLLRCYESLGDADGIFHVEETNSMMFQVRGGRGGAEGRVRGAVVVQATCESPASDLFRHMCTRPGKQLYSYRLHLSAQAPPANPTPPNPTPPPNTRFAASLRTDISPERKEARPLSQLDIRSI
jgi:hypothetical protein